MKQTFEQLTEQRGDLFYLREGAYTTEDHPMGWHLRGLTWTATGYGAKIPSRRMVRLSDGRLRRVYVTCYSNSGTSWINLDGHTFVIVRD